MSNLLLVLIALCLMGTVSANAPSWVITAMSYNDYYLMYPWYYIMKYVFVFPLKWALCNYGLSYIYQFVSSIVKPQMTGQT